MYKLFLLVLIGFTTSLTAQVNGFVENFDDNILSGWEVPSSQTGGTFTLTEADSVLKIDYNRNSGSWEWDNFNYTPQDIIDATNNPYITLRAKSDINTVLTFKPIYENGESDWLQASLPSDNLWHNYSFELIAAKPYQINRIYIYLDGGTTESKSGIIYFDDMRIGDSVRTADMLDLSNLEKLIDDANNLYDYAVEGSEEGQFTPGTKSILKTYIDDAEQFTKRTDLTNDMVDSCEWVLADACVNLEISVNAADIGLIDPKATKETKYLYINLDEIAGSFVLFGMHDATGYGVGWSGDDDRSDVKDVCGSYPAVYSEDMNKVDRNLEVNRMRYRLTSAYNRGGVITTCWHQYDPEGRGFYSSATGGEDVVATILPGGEYHQFYKDRLHKIALFYKTLRGANGESIPVIFRPYHEHTGGWFWWGDGQCTVDEYNAVWRFTVEYLRDSLNVHNLIYALSPSAQHINSEQDYYNIFPGEDYIDIFAFDKYFSFNITSAEVEEFKNDLRRVALASIDKGKVAAVAEVGQENVTTSDLFTNYILEPIKTDTLTRKMSYAAVWRNQDTGHHFAPYPGHASVPDFIDFYNDSYTIFENNIPNMYQLSSSDTIPPQIVEYPDSEFTAYYSDVELRIKTNERSFIRYADSDLSYEEMSNDFQNGQGGFDHSTVINGIQGESYHLYIRAADYNGNAMSSSIEVVFTVDTLLRPVQWTEKYYSVSDWQRGSAPFHFEGDSQEGTIVPYSRTVYFRKVFTVKNPDSLYQIVAFVQYDNGFVLYVNGHELRRVNMPAEEDIEYTTWAGSSTQTSISLTLDSSVLPYFNDGENVMAIEVHQNAADSSDLKFDLRLIDPDELISFGSEWDYYAERKAPQEKTIGETPVKERNILNIPRQLELAQNYPNPFNPETTIPFAVNKAGNVRIVIYDITGRRVTDLINRKMQPGRYSVKFNGAAFASGIYYYRLITADQSLVRKMILIK